MNELTPSIPDRAYAGDQNFKTEIHEAAAPTIDEEIARALFTATQGSNVVVELNEPGFGKPREAVEDDSAKVVLEVNEPGFLQPKPNVVLEVNEPGFKLPRPTTTSLPLRILGLAVARTPIGGDNRRSRGRKGLSTPQIDNLDLRPRPKTESATVETEDTAADASAPKIEIPGGELSTPLIDALDLRRKP